MGSFLSKFGLLLAKVLGPIGLKGLWAFYQKYVEHNEDHVKVVVTLQPDGITGEIANLLETAPNGDMVLSFVVSVERIGGLLANANFPLPFEDGKRLHLGKVKSVEVFAVNV